MKRVIVGMSGGVDSSVAAQLLIEQGYEVEGLFMNNWEEDDTYCTAAQDFQDARQVCEELDIPLHKANFSQEYKDRVFSYFLEEYQAGRTPNPDVLCNREIKFKAFLDYALALGADAIATGHYARVSQTPDGQWQMLKGVDQNKDQTYFLHTIDQHALSKTLFPIGHLPKSEVRELATQAGFDNYAKKDSTGICFIGERDFQEFLAKYLPANPGDIVTPEGDVIGRHTGVMYYTLGQRKGLGIGGQRSASEEPWYVVDKNLDENQLIVAQGHNHPLMMQHGLIAEQVHWISERAMADGQTFTCTAKSRYRQADQACAVTVLDEQRIRVEFTDAQRAITPGQWVVLYDGEQCLGGGVIAEILH